MKTRSVNRQTSAKPSKPVEIYIGTAGWTLPKQHTHYFGQSTEEKLSHLQRYASVLNCAEINSSFHRSHQRKTWERWAASTPEDFRFAVKVPKAITHTAKLANCGGLLQEFLGQCMGLNSGPVAKLGPLLVQLPPALAFDEGLAHEFFTTVRELYPFADAGESSARAMVDNQHDESTGNCGLIALEPRHSSWFTSTAGRLMRDFKVARVAADPPKGSPLAADPGGWPGLRYYRLHGSPRTYYSDYNEEFLNNFAATLRDATTHPIWVIFDNTALGGATGNALSLQRSLLATFDSK